MKRFIFAPSSAANSDGSRGGGSFASGAAPCAFRMLWSLRGRRHH